MTKKKRKTKLPSIVELSGPPVSAPADPKRLWLSILLIVSAGLLLYANALKGDFVFDDDLLVKGNQYIKDLSNIGRIFVDDVGEGGGADYDFYRPLQLLSYMADHAVWGLNPFGFHLTSILIHIGAALALFWFIRILFQDATLALITALLFVIHPIHTEAVTYISGRTDPLSTLFILLTLIFTLKAADTRRASLLVFTILSYAAALLSREHSLIVPVLILLCGSVSRKKLPKAHVFAVAGLAILYVILRVTVLESAMSLGERQTTFLQRVPGFFIALVSYVRLLFLPMPLHMEYGTIIFPWSSPKALMGGVLLAAALFFLWREKTRRGLMFFSLAWFFIGILPVSNLYPLNAFMAEHWLYLPSIGFFLLMAKGITFCLQQERWKRPALAGAVILGGFWAVLTVRQNVTWLDPLAFFERTLRYAPQSSIVHNNLGMLYLKRGDAQKGAAYSERAIQLDPGNHKAVYNLGLIYSDMGKTTEAERYYKKSLEIKPGYAKALNNLAMIYSQTGRYDEAVALTQKAVGPRGTNIKAYNNMAIAYVRMGKNREAVEICDKILAVDPRNDKALNTLGVAYLNTGELEKALSVYQKLVQIAPDYPEARNNMGLVYRAMNKLSESALCFEKAVELRAGYGNALNNLADAYSALGRDEEAEAAREKARVLKE